MKNLLLAVALALGLSACATIPQPKSAGDSLVIGNLVLQFPDGFLGQPARTVGSYLLLHFRDVTTNTRFVRLAVDGYFYFRGNGSDEYRLESYEYSNQDYGGDYYLNDSIRQSFSAVPGKLVYVGQIAVRYEKPRISNRVTFAEATIFDDSGMSDHFPTMHQTLSVFWQYDRTFDRRWDDSAVIAYLQRKDPHSPWLQAELTH